MATTLTFAIPVEWSNTRTYEINNIVFVGKKAYTAIQNVPTGIEITNTLYWSETGVPFVDLSEIRSKLAELDDDVTQNTSDISDAQDSIVVNANNITTLTNRLNTAVTNLESEVARVNNIMITLYTPNVSS